MHRRPLVVIAAIGVFALHGCALPFGGPIELGGDQGETCIPGDPGQPVVLGEVLGLADGQEATLTAVTVVDAENLSLEHSYILDSPVGAMYPDEIDDWADRREAVGATISGEQTSLVVVLSRDNGADPGTASHMRVTYTAGGIAYEADATTAYVIADSCS